MQASISKALAIGTLETTSVHVSLVRGSGHSKCELRVSKTHPERCGMLKEPAWSA